MVGGLSAPRWPNAWRSISVDEADRPPHQGLSDREFEVMRLLGAGKSVGQIAGLLSLSDKTISTYRARILQKMHLETTADIVRYVIENKLTE